MKHTPGPWSRLTLIKQHGKVDQIQFGPIDYAVGQVNCYGENSKANANLIAVAPEMLQSLDILVNELGALKLVPDTATYEFIQNTIKKAKGEA